MAASKRIPKLRHHKGSGQAVVTIDGRDHYCGKYGTRESVIKYRELIERLQATREAESVRREVALPGPSRTISELMVAFIGISGPRGIGETRSCVRSSPRPWR